MTGSPQPRCQWCGRDIYQPPTGGTTTVGNGWIHRDGNRERCHDGDSTLHALPERHH